MASFGLTVLISCNRDRLAAVGCVGRNLPRPDTDHEPAAQDPQASPAIGRDKLKADVTKR